MVKIRLSRRGAKKRPFYHIVVTDSRNGRDDRSFIEEVGYYNPVAQGKETPLFVNLERVEHWLSVGAQTSTRVHTLLKQAHAQASSDAANNNA